MCAIFKELIKQFIVFNVYIVNIFYELNSYFKGRIYERGEFMGDNIKADDIARLAKMFGVNFTQKDTNTLQKWM